MFLTPNDCKWQIEKSPKSRCPFLMLLIEVHYEWWRRILKYFWMSVVMYTMLVLTVVYTFQFPESINTWGNMTGLDKTGWATTGLRSRILTHCLPAFGETAQSSNCLEPLLCFGTSSVTWPCYKHSFSRFLFCRIENLKTLKKIWNHNSHRSYFLWYIYRQSDKRCEEIISQVGIFYF